MILTMFHRTGIVAIDLYVTVFKHPPLFCINNWIPSDHRFSPIPSNNLRKIFIATLVSSIKLMNELVNLYAQL